MTAEKNLLLRRKIAPIINQALEEGVTQADLSKRIEAIVGPKGVGIGVFGLQGIKTWLEERRYSGTVTKDGNNRYRYSPPGSNVLN